MLENVKLAGYDVPTPIQQYCLPAIFKGHDIVACAQTGNYDAFKPPFSYHVTKFVQVLERPPLS